MIPCAEIVSRASIINTWKILGDYQVFVENTWESLLTLGSVADSSSVCAAELAGAGRSGRSWVDLWALKGRGVSGERM